MNKRTKSFSIGLAAASIILAGGQVLASEQDEFPYYTEIDSCIAAVGDKANYDDAVRVRHTVVRVKRTRKGHVFTIDTAVFVEPDGDAIRKYASYCVVRGTKKPVKFEISETTIGA